MYPYIVSADYYFDQRSQKMEQYYEGAKELAGFFNSCHQVSTNPAVPVSNMFHVHFQAPKEQVESVLVELYEETGIGFTSYLREINDAECNCEVSMGDLYEKVPKEKVKQTFQLLDEKMRAIRHWES